MQTILSDRFAPTTSAVGFIGLPIDIVAQALIRRRRAGRSNVRTTTLRDPFPDVLRSLEPLTSRVRPRELLVQTANPIWTAYFDCGIFGGDPVSTVGQLSRDLRCNGVVATAIPHTAGTGFESPGRLGACTFQLYGPRRTEFLNHVRTVSVVHDGTAWRFEQSGTVQYFEEEQAYSSASTRDRFTSRMLADYCSALGIDLFGEAFFRGPSTRIESPLDDSAESEESVSLGLADDQRWLGIVPSSGVGLGE